MGMFLTANGDLFVAGSNTYGQLGDGTQIDRTGAVFVTGSVADIA